MGLIEVIIDHLVCFFDSRDEENETYDDGTSTKKTFMFAPEEVTFIVILLFGFLWNLGLFL